MEIFSERLKLARNKKGMTQKELSEEIGVSQQYYNQFEKNKGEPNLETLAKIATILKVNTDYLLGLTDAEDTRKTAESEFERRLHTLEKTILDIILKGDKEATELFNENLKINENK
ncbi:helix-turn-helix transcriptional regulator [Paenibacillus qinlingensis]|uniref:Transcriptional regulator with XRE-family HTH domain n=1 Tax=Paenibacillus qinlingensis TaxID=1837343 RepID=A0ABU1P8H1_9BACL|nr:helix-turn-helix transcriptional regulator [Paenibacillus qinlingensis]MDR6555497.1 transcriptional regulator with XRE-family HTH domain [Paenibacillus qinlingensis]